MRELHCPNCGTPFVRVTYQEGRVENLLSRVNVFPFRCQLCTNRFRAFYSSARHNTQAFDRRQYTRLAASIEAQVLDYKQPAVTNRITDISMDGCTLQVTGFPKGAFIELVLKPMEEDQSIRIETAMVCSVRPLSMGIRFLEIPPEHYRRLAQVVLGLLVGQGLDPTLNS
ncbi:MAG TPA: PilZ domain-containing protein [Nitrospiraceae bacterium]|nr:PilZ domain-containing protein [Nitrospiraceae bacterium]